jgi:hypothetical protein
MIEISCLAGEEEDGEVDERMLLRPLGALMIKAILPRAKQSVPFKGHRMNPSPSR